MLNSAKSTTFFTTMAEVHSADYLSSRYSDLRKSVGFYIDCANARKAGKFQIEILDKRGRLKANGQPIELDDQMHLVGAPAHRDISFRRHLEDLRKYEELLGEYPGSNPIEVERLPRIELVAA